MAPRVLPRSHGVMQIVSDKYYLGAQIYFRALLAGVIDLIRFCWIFLTNISKLKGKFDIFCILSGISIAT